MSIQQQNKQNPFDFRMEASDNIVKMYLYGDVVNYSWWTDSGDIVPTEIKNALQDAAGKELEVHIHSPGGDAYAGFAIYSLFKAYTGKKVMIIDGIAASAASIIAMAADELKVSSAGMLMIHNAWSMSWGNHNDLRKSADDLEKLSNNGAKLYQHKTGKTLEEIKQLMDDETYMNADEALELGFVDEILYVPEMKMHLSKNGLMWGNLDVSNYLPLIQNKQSAKQQINQNKTVQQSVNLEEGGNIMPQNLTLDALKTEHKEIYQQVVAEITAQAQAGERSRMKAIQEVALPGHEQLMNTAMYDTPMSVGDFALAQAQAEKQMLANARQQHNANIQASNVNNVTADPIENQASGTNLDNQDNDDKTLALMKQTINKYMK